MKKTWYTTITISATLISIISIILCAITVSRSVGVEHIYLFFLCQLLLTAVVWKMLYLSSDDKSEIIKDEWKLATPEDATAFVNISNTKRRFSIEFHPVSKRYYPKYGKNYFYVDKMRDLVSADAETIDGLVYSSTIEQEAINVINRFKELHLKEGIEVKYYD